MCRVPGIFSTSIFFENVRRQEWRMKALPWLKRDLAISYFPVGYTGTERLRIHDPWNEDCLTSQFSFARSHLQFWQPRKVFSKRLSKEVVYKIISIGTKLANYLIICVRMPLCPDGSNMMYQPFLRFKKSLLLFYQISWLHKKSIKNCYESFTLRPYFHSDQSGLT